MSLIRPAALLIAVLLVLPAAIPVDAWSAERAKSDAHLVRVDDVEVRMTLVGPVVLLRVQKRAIPVFVDATVAQSIQAVVSGEKPPRPLSHDLMHSILTAYDGRVTRAVITLKGETYYGDLTVSVQGTTRVFDSRSSDAIALATHFKAPVFVPRDLLEKVGVELEAPPEIRPGGVRL